MKKLVVRFFEAGILSLTILLLTGCPPTTGPENPNEGEGETPFEGEGEVGPGYAEGYQEGFFTDSKYWEGYDDSYDTEPPDGPILYSGSEIPYIEDETYEAGYNDGLWYAYNDGYFVSYDYGFTIGFSEGYDVTFNDGWYDFLMVDEHPEYSDGSFLDGYMDGFSEGSVFGAYDYKTGLSFDWEDAMWDYRSGTDLYLEEVGFGTGQYGNVFLYEYGVDPATYFEKSETNSGRKTFGAVRIPRNADAAKAVVSPRASVEKALKALKQDGSEEHAVSYRALSNTASTELNVRPESSPRLQGYTLTLPDTWLERIERYRAERQ